MITYDIPNTLVQITLRRFTGYVIPPAFIRPFIASALDYLDTTASQEGGPTAPFGPDRQTIGHSSDGIVMNFNDITIHNPEVAGGRTRFDEVRAVYQGIAAVIQKLGYEECHIDAFRMVNGRTGKIRVKELLSGYLTNAHSMAGLITSSELAATEG
ncbi:MAG: hypothetical protein Q9221_009080 [Calogaya cf. arnoldii]